MDNEKVNALCPELQDPVRTSLISWLHLKLYRLPPGGATTTASAVGPLQQRLLRQEPALRYETAH